MTEFKHQKGAIKLTKVEQIQNRIDELTTAINAGDSDVQLTLWEMERTEKIKELAAEETQQQDAQVQQQAQVAQTDGLKETIRSIRDAVYLKELMDRALGITENATATQDFNSMVDQAVDEDQTALYTAFNTQLEQRDEKFRALTLQALETQRQLDEAREVAQTSMELADKWAHENKIQLQEINDLKQKQLTHDTEIDDLQTDIQRLKTHEFELQQQIANVQTKPQIIDITPTTPSESLADKIAQAKVASIKQFSNLYSEVTYTDSTKEVVHNSQIPSLPIPELPTLQQVASQNVEQSAHPEQVNHFPETEVQTGNTEGNPTVEGNTAIPETLGERTAAEEETLTLESLKAEIDTLKTAHDATALTVARIAEKANLPIAV